MFGVLFCEDILMEGCGEGWGVVYLFVIFRFREGDQMHLAVAEVVGRNGIRCCERTRDLYFRE